MKMNFKEAKREVISQCFANNYHDNVPLVKSCRSWQELASQVQPWMSESLRRFFDSNIIAGKWN